MRCRDHPIQTTPGRSEGDRWRKWAKTRSGPAQGPEQWLRKTTHRSLTRTHRPADHLQPQPPCQHQRHMMLPAHRAASATGAPGHRPRAPDHDCPHITTRSPGPDHHCLLTGRQVWKWGRYSTMRAVTMPNIPLGPSAWVRMWQWKAHTPGNVGFTTTVYRSPGATLSVSTR